MRTIQIKNRISKTGWEKLHEIRNAFRWLFFLALPLATGVFVNSFKALQPGFDSSKRTEF